MENKKKIYDNVKKINNKSNNLNKNTKNNEINDEKIISKRVFNPDKQEDMNLLITKEILNDMINRIEYNFEDLKYLRRYLRSRIEEIIETNNLLDEDL